MPVTNWDGWTFADPEIGMMVCSADLGSAGLNRSVSGILRRCRLKAYRRTDEVGDGFGSAVWWPGDDRRDGRCVRHRHGGVTVA